jgi:hypothetical protein
MSVIGMVVLVLVGIVIGVVISVGLVMDIKRERAINNGNLNRYFDSSHTLPTSGSDGVSKLQD